MHPQNLLIALVAPFVLSLPQPNIQGEVVALVARHGHDRNFTAGGEGTHHRQEYHDLSGTRHQERHFTEEQGAGNSTGGSKDRWREGDKDGEWHHAERDLTERHGSSNSTQDGDHRQGDFNGKKYGHPESQSHHQRDLPLSSRPDNSTHHDGDNHEHDFKDHKPPHHNINNKPRRDLPPSLSQWHEKPGNVTNNRLSYADYHKDLSYIRKGEKGRNGTRTTAGDFSYIGKEGEKEKGDGGRGRNGTATSNA